MIYSSIPILLSFLFLFLYGAAQSLDSIRPYSPQGQPSFSAKRDIEIRDSISQFRFNADTNLIADPIKNLELSPLALIITVDGKINAVKRDTGQWVWTVHDDGGTKNIASEDLLKRARAGEGIGGNLIKGSGRRQTSSRTSTLELDQTALEELNEREEEIYIIEPKDGGEIYLYTRSGSGTSSTLQKLPLSMTQLVSLSPFTFSADSSKMFIGRKETKLVGIDLKSGRLVGVFGSEDGWCDWDQKKEGRIRTEEECEDDIQRTPENLLYIARTGRFPTFEVLISNVIL